MIRSAALALVLALASVSLATSACIALGGRDRSDREDDDDDDDDDDGGEGEGEGEGETDDGDACVSGERTRGPSEPCCLDFGVDACGAGLFCAAFDGRTVPTCYVEGTRLDGEDCDEDAHCASSACHPELDVCMALPGQLCERSVGCALVGGVAYVCVDNGGGDRCLTAGRNNGGFCDADDGCNSSICIDDRCSDGGVGDSCDDDDDCGSGICALGECASGADGSACINDDDCAPGLACHGTCGPPDIGDGCDNDSDCSAVLGGCFANQCVAHSEGQSCDSDPDCGPLLGCLSGTCASTCTDSLACMFQGLLTGQTLECRTAGCAEVGALGETCVVNTDCATDTLALNCFTDRCLKRSGAGCSVDGDCGSNACDPVQQLRCVDDDDGGVGASCATTPDCGTGRQCLPRTVNICD